MYPVTALRASYIYIYSQLSKRRCNLLHTEIAFTFPYPLHRVNQYRRRRIQGGGEGGDAYPPSTENLMGMCFPPEFEKGGKEGGQRNNFGSGWGRDAVLKDKRAEIVLSLKIGFLQPYNNSTPYTDF